MSFFSIFFIGDDSSGYQTGQISRGHSWLDSSFKTPRDDDICAINAHRMHRSASLVFLW